MGDGRRQRELKQCDEYGSHHPDDEEERSEVRVLPREELDTPEKRRASLRVLGGVGLVHGPLWLAHRSVRLRDLGWSPFGGPPEYLNEMRDPETGGEPEQGTDRRDADRFLERCERGNDT